MANLDLSGIITRICADLKTKFSKVTFRKDAVGNFDITIDGTLYHIGLPEPASQRPPMDGTAATGMSTFYARADHVHPTDTSRQAALAVETGTLSKGSAASSLGTNSCRRYGKLVIVSVNGMALASALSSGSTSGTLATVPSGYRPHAAIRVPFGSSGNNVGYVTVSTAGAITLRNSGSGSIATSASLAFELVYVIA